MLWAGKRSFIEKILINLKLVNSRLIQSIWYKFRTPFRRAHQAVEHAINLGEEGMA